MGADSTDAAALVVVLPVFDDWVACARLLPTLIEVLKPIAPFGLLLIDDGSVQRAPGDLLTLSLPPGCWLKVLELRRNMGHQRAIAVGLCFVHERIACEQVVVMDADGEDRPEDVPQLIARARSEEGEPLVFAGRSRRVEGPLFRLGYLVYRTLHRILTGRGVRIGNFSVIPRRRLESLVVVSELWIHYAAAAVRSRQAWCEEPTTRGRRLDGRSRMNLVSLVVHGLSAIAVYSDIVFTRLVLFTSAVIVAALAGLAGVIGVRLFTSLAIPGWASYVAGILLVLLLQSASFVASLVFLVLGQRQQGPVIPIRDFHYYVRAVHGTSPGPS